jgi:protein-arginine kinase activator protein McsA
MKARLLGSNPLTALVRCPCGYRNFFSKQDWSKLGFARCDNCNAIIAYNSLRVISTRCGRFGMSELNATFEQTPEREEIVAELQKAQASMERVGELLRQGGYSERARRADNIAQRIINKRELLCLDWQDEDAEKAA